MLLPDGRAYVTGGDMNGPGSPRALGSDVWDPAHKSYVGRANNMGQNEPYLPLNDPLFFASEVSFWLPISSGVLTICLSHLWCSGPMFRTWSVNQLKRCVAIYAPDCRVVAACPPPPCGQRTHARLVHQIAFQTMAGTCRHASLCQRIPASLWPVALMRCAVLCRWEDTIQACGPCTAVACCLRSQRLCRSSTQQLELHWPQRHLCPATTIGNTHSQELRCAPIKTLPCTLPAVLALCAGTARCCSTLQAVAHDHQQRTGASLAWLAPNGTLSLLTHWYRCATQ